MASDSITRGWMAKAMRKEARSARVPCGRCDGRLHCPLARALRGAAVRLTSGSLAACGTAVAALVGVDAQLVHLQRVCAGKVGC